MLKRMRWKFIGAAMAAFSAVVLMLLCAVNLWNYTVNTDRLDATLESLNESDRRGQSPLGGDFHRRGPFDRFSPEMRYMTRFFTVCCGADGSVLSVEQDFIASISAEDAALYAEKVLKTGASSGYEQNYRFRVWATEEGSTLIFLNAEQELQTMKTVLLISAVTALASLLAVFALVLLFSGRAIAPYLRNIETQKRFITDAGHELKTPLTAIATSADVLAMEQPEDEWVRNIQTQVKRLSRLITDLVTLSRLDEEQPFPERSDFSLSEAVWEISTPYTALAAARGRKYEQTIEEGITLHGDRAAIQQMVSLLLDNAVKYSDEGGTVRLKLCRRQRRAELTVYNTCRLEDPAHIDRLFDRFYRPDASRSAASGGTGVGLSIAAATAQAHGGSITATTDGGRDITFTVIL